MIKIWNMYPEDPIKYKSLVEIIILSLLFVLCAFLFWRWNVVSQRNINLRVEQIRPEIDTAYQYCNTICIKVPMTSQDDFIKDSVPLKITTSIYNKKVAKDHFTYISFIIDSLRHVNSNGDKLLVRATDYAELYGLSYESYYIYKNYNEMNKNLDSIYSEPFKIKDVVKGKPVRYINMTQSISYGVLVKNNIHLINNPKPVDSLGMLENYEAEIIDNKTIKTTAYGTGHYATSDYNLSLGSNNKGRFYLNPFSPGAVMEKPRWGRLEDVSQAYVNLKLETATVDSINLVFDFVGCTEFSAMDPMPDKVTMSSIEFNDPVKIFKIRANGLRFHAKFVELQNWQSIRVFGVTAIMSGLLIVLITFIILFFFKLRRISKSHKKSDNKKGSEEAISCKDESEPQEELLEKEETSVYDNEE